MDEHVGASAGKSDAIQPPPLAAKEGNGGGGQSPEQYTDGQEKPTKWGRIRTLRQFFTKSEWVMVFLTFVIATTGVVGIILVIQSSGDTRKIIAAAQQQACAARQIAAASNRNAVAAESFATSAGQISDGIGESVKKLAAQAKATQTSAKAAEIALKLQVSDYNPILDIGDVRGNNLFPDPSDRIPNQPTNFFVSKDQISFQFFVSNGGRGEAKNIHFAMSDAHQVRNGIPANLMADEIRMVVERGGINLTEAGMIWDLEGGTKTQHPVVYTARPGIDPGQLLRMDIAEWFYGELYWDNELGATHGWKRRLCFVIRPNTGYGQTITSCGIPQEGVSPR